MSRTRTGKARSSVRLPLVDFDPAALGLLAAQPAGEYLDVHCGAAGPSAGLALRVSPDAPSGPSGLPSAIAAVVGYGTAGRVRALVRRDEPDPHHQPVIHLED